MNHRNLKKIKRDKLMYYKLLRELPHAILVNNPLFEYEGRNAF